MYVLDKSFPLIDDCVVIFRRAPWWGSEIIAELHEHGRSKFSIRVTERYIGPDLDHDQVMQEMETRLLAKRMEDLEIANDV